MKGIGARIAAIAFPASALVILGAAAVQGFTGDPVNEAVTAAATGLVTWLGFVLLGAGTKA